jgi:hypothetical protein
MGVCRPSTRAIRFDGGTGIYRGTSKIIRIARILRVLSFCTAPGTRQSPKSSGMVPTH